MKFEWSEEKRLWTLEDRALDFRDAGLLFDGRPLYTYPSPREEEARFESVGSTGRHCIAVIWMEREGVRRIISMRRAWHAEERALRSLYE